jgi:hypothetical protein
VILVFLGGGVPGVGWGGGFGSLFFGVALPMVSIETSRGGGFNLFVSVYTARKKKSSVCEAKPRKRRLA